MPAYAGKYDIVRVTWITTVMSKVPMLMVEGMHVTELTIIDDVVALTTIVLSDTDRWYALKRAALSVAVKLQ